MRQNRKPKYILYHKITLVYLLDNQSIHNISFRKNDMGGLPLPVILSGRVQIN